MKKPCWIFRLLNSTINTIHLLINTPTVKSISHNLKRALYSISNFIMNILAIIVETFMVVLKTCFTIGFIIAGTFTVIAVTIVIGLPLSNIILSRATTNITTTKTGMQMIVPSLKVFSVGVVTIIGFIIACAVLYVLYKVVYHSAHYIQQNILAAKLWQRHEKHANNN